MITNRIIAATIEAIDAHWKAHDGIANHADIR